VTGACIALYTAAMINPMLIIPVKILIQHEQSMSFRYRAEHPSIDSIEMYMGRQQGQTIKCKTSN